MARMMFEFLGQLIVGLFGGAKPEGELIGPVGCTGDVHEY